jgi:hypothetical protein
MNLIDLFESKKFQDVGTFNSIFKTSPILGRTSSAPVKICEVVPGNRRRVLVGEEELFLDLTQSKASRSFLEEPEKVRVGRIKRELATKGEAKLPAEYRRLSPSEFMVFSALRELKSVDGATELSRHVSITQRTVYSSVESLVAKGFAPKRACH